MVMANYQKFDVKKIQLGENVAVDAQITVALPRHFGAADVMVNVAGRLTNADKGFVLDAKADCCAVMACSRCLEAVKQEISFRINENFVEEELVCGDSEDIGFSNKIIDILPAVQRNLFLNIPMKLLCAADCAGLCPKCGKNLNEGECDCEGEINEQFRDLLQFFED